mgnify:CR=1 FL=1
MQLDRIGLQLRRRSAWEALDLGHALLRAWAWPAYRVWLISFWGCGLLLTALLWRWPGWAVFILWWLKPLFDRLLLFTYSRALFGNPVRLIDVWRELPHLLRHSGLVAGLLWRRLSTVRSLVLPVWQLEGQTGQAARARSRLLARRTGGHAVWLTFVCANLVGILWIAAIMILEVLLPVGSEGIFQWSDWWENTLPPWKEMIANLLWMLAETLIEPFYVASGFSLYLNRRSELEGWDIELGFRRLADRIREAGTHTLGGLALAIMVGISLVSASPPASAAEPPERARPVIQEVLKDPVFGQKTEEKEWRWRQTPDKPEESKKPDWFDRFLRFFELLSEALRGLLWVIAALVAVALVSVLIRYRDRWLPRRSGRAPPPDFLFGLDVRPDSLPADVVAAARALFAAGRCREGLSLLYRGALVALIHRLHVEFRAGDTEGDCLRRVRGKLDAAAESHFAELLAAWQSTAYAERAPSPEALENLCLGWALHFAEAAR